MIVYPDIELQNGRCVNLWRGQKNNPVVYDIEPVEAAINFVDKGAQWLHVVDLDAVFGEGDNANLIKKIIGKVDVGVQVAGAIRSIDTVRGWIDAGAERVVIATAAVKDPTFLRQAALAYPDQVVLSVDGRQGRVMVDGWRETTIFTPIEFARQFEDLPLAAVIYTDIDRDADGPESSMSQTEELAEAVQIPVIASGIVKTLDDISTIKFLPNIAGAITGRAIFNGELDLADAIAIATQTTEPIAPIT
jgi:phosphoribosylformimino-5-aminoimidazole carboxamide ribotide isomerase